MIVIMAGLPGAGKTTLARAMAAATSGVALNKDEIRSTLFPPGDVEYSSEQDDLCMKLLLEAAGFLLNRNPARVVLIDGRPFSKSAQLQQVLDVADRLKQEWRILECVCSEGSARGRLEASGDEHPAANRNYELYLRLRSNWQEITTAKTVIDTERPLEECLVSALSALGSL
jgi:predicted kinase